MGNKIDYTKNLCCCNNKQDNLDINLPESNNQLNNNNINHETNQELITQLIKNRNQNKIDVSERLNLTNDSKNTKANRKVRFTNNAKTDACILVTSESKGSNSQYKEIKNDFCDEERLIKILRRNNLFQGFPDKLLITLINHSILIQLSKEAVLFSESDNADFFYLVKSGYLDNYIKDTLKETYKQNSLIGLVNLVQKSKRMSIVKSREVSQLYVFSNNIFRECQNLFNEKILPKRFFFLDLIPLMKTLDSNQKNNIATLMMEKKYKKNEHIFKEGDKGESFYLIKSGSVNCITSNGVCVRVIKKGEYFGENSILFDSNRSLTVYANETSILYEVSIELLANALGSNFKNKIVYNVLRDNLQSNLFFSKILVESQYEEIFSKIKLVKYSARELYYNHENPVEKKIIYIFQGELINSKNNVVLAQRGDLFGELILDDRNIIDFNIISKMECFGVEFNWKLIVNSNDKLSKNKKINKLKKLEFFKYLSDSKLQFLSQKMIKESFQKGEYIVKEGDFADKFYYIHKGSVSVLKDNKVLRILVSGNSFGEMALLKDEKRSANIVSIGTEIGEPAITYSILKKDFIELMNETLLKHMVNKMNMLNTNIDINDLYFITKLGKGKFGNVFLVHNTKCLYALKSVSRKRADRQKYLSKYYISERNISLAVDHPFIVKCVKTFKDESRCYFLIEFINGLNFNIYLSDREETMMLYDTKFYVGSILLILDYLSKNKIVHRDLKPDNIMINKNGYLKLVDFGTSKEIIDFTNTILGTPHYMAPEVIQGRGYGTSPDFWSAGICAFEIFYGFYPFGDKASDIMEIYNEILNE